MEVTYLAKAFEVSKALLAHPFQQRAWLLFFSFDFSFPGVLALDFYIEYRHERDGCECYQGVDYVCLSIKLNSNRMPFFSLFLIK